MGRLLLAHEQRTIGHEKRAIRTKVYRRVLLFTGPASISSPTFSFLSLAFRIQSVHVPEKDLPCLLYGLRRLNCAEPMVRTHTVLYLYAKRVLVC